MFKVKRLFFKDFPSQNCVFSSDPTVHKKCVTVVKNLIGRFGFCSRSIYPTQTHKIQIQIHLQRRIPQIPCFMVSLHCLIYVRFFMLDFYVRFLCQIFYVRFFMLDFLCSIFLYWIFYVKLFHVKLFHVKFFYVRLFHVRLFYD